MIRTLRTNDELAEFGSESVRWQVVDSTLRDGCIKLFDRVNHEEKYKTLSLINNEIANGQLILVNRSTPHISVAAQDDPDLDKKLRSAMEQMKRVDYVREKRGVSLAVAYTIAKDEYEKTPGSNKRFPSRATIYRHYAAKRNEVPLLKGNKNKGNRSPRYGDSVIDLVCTSAETLYLHPESRWCLRDLITYINDKAHELELIKQSETISRNFVKKTIFRNICADSTIPRLDPKLVPSAKSIASNLIKASRPFERVEQDGLHLPFVIQTNHGPTNSVHLIHAIDCCTGMPVGWNIFIGAPNQSEGLKCIESILFSKKDAFERLGLTYCIDPCGTPHQLVLDNGPEARGDRIDKLIRLGIDVVHCKSRHAHSKPYIERLNRSLKEALQTLPGCTRHNEKDGKRDPLKLGDSLMSLEELERWIVRWYFEDWANNELTRHTRTDLYTSIKLGKTPVSRWSRMTTELGYALPLSPVLTEWYMTIYQHETKTLSRKTGVTYKGYVYRGENLPYLVDKYGENPVKILVDPDDFRQIYVDQGHDLPLVPLTEVSVDETTPAYSFDFLASNKEERELSAAARTEMKKFRNDLQHRSIEPARPVSARTRRKIDRERNVVHSTKHDTAVRKASMNPIKTDINADLTHETMQKIFDLDDVVSLPIIDHIARGEKK